MGSRSPSERKEASPDSLESSAQHNDRDLHLLIVDELSRVFYRRDDALLLAQRAGVPASRLLEFSTPLVFWNQLARDAEHGLLDGGIRPIVQVASRLFPHNEIFARSIDSPSSVTASERPEPTHTSSQCRPLQVLMSYAREDRTLGEELGKHLKLMQRQGLIAPWTLHEIEAGTDRDDAVAQGLKTANIILLLISASYLGSDFCWEREMSRALERHQSRQASVVPVLVRPCDWESAPFGKLQVLPRNARPVRSDAWKTEDDAWVEITRDIRSLVQRVLAPV